MSRPDGQATANLFNSDQKALCTQPTVSTEEPRLITTAQSSWQLRWQMLSEAGFIVVREPVGLREEMIRQLEAGLVAHLGCTASQP